MSTLHKRGQGNPAATLIGVITLLIIFYLLFLPAEERRELLEGNNDTFDRIRSDTDDDNVTLLLANIGTLERQPRSAFEHTIPNIQLVETRNAQVIQDFNPFVIKNGWFVTDTQTKTFTIADPAITSNAQLVLDAPVQQGILTIELNNRVVYEAAPTGVNIPPVLLRTEQLQRENTLEFSVSEVGLAFWKTNSYQFSTAQVIADITDLGRQQSENVINLGSVEINQLKTATLRFFPVCTRDQVGPLEVFLNNERISASVPDCQSVNRLELDPANLFIGRNTLAFRITKGSYRIEQIKLNTRLEEAQTFINFFEINKSRYDDIRTRRRDLTLRIEFVDDDKTKRAEININGRKDFIDQKDPVYERDLRTYAQEGNNYIEITPKTDLNIVKLEIILE